MKKIGIVFWKTDDYTLRTSQEAANWLKTRGIETCLPKRPELSHGLDIPECEDFPNGCDVLLSLGGDGTLLRSVEYGSPQNIPVLGVNLGNLGYLTEVEKTEFQGALERVLAGDFQIERRLMLKGELLRTGEVLKTIYALNDIYFYRDMTSRIIATIIYIDNQRLGRTRADGIIVNTPTGSTAYALAAGGPIIDPKTEAFCITPICPHDFNQRPIIIPADKRITLEFEMPQGTYGCFADGQIITPLVSHDKAIISRCSHDALLVRLNKKDFYKVLSSVFHWSD
jgi:NAD+ kinase